MDCNSGSTEKNKFYSRKELEALRYEGIEGQRQKWVEVYCGLGPVVQKEYDELLNSNHHRQLKQQISLNQEPSLDFGECTEADDSDEDYGTIQKVAFFVAGEPDFDSGPPEDGLEYLKRVRWEAARIPKVKIAKVDSSKLNKEQTVYMPQIPDIVKCPAHLMPLKEWEDAFLADFAELRQVLSHFEISIANNAGKMQSFTSRHEEETFCQPLEISIPENYDMSDGDGSCESSDITMRESASNLVTKSVAAVEDHSSSSKESPSSSVPSGIFGNHPTLSTILGMDAVARVMKLKKHIKMAETASTLSKDEFCWLFALCAAVDTPLHADTSAALRSLLRKCASLRATKSELDEEVIMLNILATISGRYFGQLEN